jgi:hypothetical protein
MEKELGIAAAGQLLGIGLGQMFRGQQMADQEKLMAQQLRNQKDLNKHQQELQMETWRKTNYNAQRQQMEKAGLNVGLMYEGGGAGGQSTSSVGGSASGGNAPQTQTQGMGMMLQAQQIASQTKLNEALANKANADATRAGGSQTNVDVAQAGNLEANTALTKMNEANAKIQNEIGSKTIEDAIYQIGANADKAQSEARSALVKANVDEKTMNSEMQKINSEAINEAFKLTLMKSNVNLNNEKARAITEELAQEWERLSIELDKVGIGKMQNAINEFTAKINAKLGQGNLDMRRIEAGLNATKGLLGNKKVDMSGTRQTTINNY